MSVAEDGTAKGGLLFELYNIMSFQNKVKSCIRFSCGSAQ